MKRSFQYDALLFLSLYALTTKRREGEVEEAVATVSSAVRWGPVRRGFSVAFPDGEHGRVEEIRIREGGVELIVSTGSGAARLCTVDGREVQAILPGLRRIIVRASPRPCREDPAAIEVAGGIVRMTARHSSRLGSPPEEAA